MAIILFLTCRTKDELKYRIRELFVVDEVTKKLQKKSNIQKREKENYKVAFSMSLIMKQKY